MPENKHAIRSDLAKLDATTDDEIARQIAEDPDTAPELTDEFFEKADFYIGEKLIRRGRGRPPLDAPKKLVSLRLDRDVIEQFRAGGPGWQSRINAALRKHLWGEPG
ncbi:MAG TPA: BrnA antitoxin family protein [Beijerinckiaceae bacterium]|nr:BrnA antitoxin family protein [Beijerinckiaceae bacterium]